MSFILDALKKSETDRQRQNGPALFEVKVAPPRNGLPVWAIGLGVLLAVNLVIVAWVLLRRPAQAETAGTQGSFQGAADGRGGAGNGAGGEGSGQGTGQGGQPGQGQAWQGGAGAQGGQNAWQGAAGGQGGGGQAWQGGQNQGGGPGGSAGQQWQGGSGQPGQGGQGGGPNGGAGGQSGQGQAWQGGPGAQGGQTWQGGQNQGGGPGGPAGQQAWQGTAGAQGGQNQGGGPAGAAGQGGQQGQSGWAGQQSGQPGYGPPGTVSVNGAAPTGPLGQAAGPTTPGGFNGAGDTGLNPDDTAPAADPVAAPFGNHVARSTSNGVPLYQQAALQPGTHLPELRLDLHVFAAQPQNRFVMINMHKLHEGDSLPEGVRVESITPEGAVLSKDGTRFMLPRQ
jgi:hypothetical protein